MGGGASTVSSQEVRTRGDTILQLNRLHKHMRIFQHNNTGEVIVLINQDIAGYLGRQYVDEWIEVQISKQQEDYLSKMKVVVAVGEKNIRPEEAKAVGSSVTIPSAQSPAEQRSVTVDHPTVRSTSTSLASERAGNSSSSTSGSVINGAAQSKYGTGRQGSVQGSKHDDDEVNFDSDQSTNRDSKMSRPSADGSKESYEQQMDPEMVKRLKVLKSAAMDGGQDQQLRDMTDRSDVQSSVTPSRPNLTTGGRRRRSRSRPRKFTPTSYFLSPDQHTITTAADIQYALTNDDLHVSSVMSSSCYYTGNLNESISTAISKPKKSKVVLNLSALNCPICNTIYYGYCSREALEDHMPLCTLKQEVRCHVDYINSSLLPAYYDIEKQAGQNDVLDNILRTIRNLVMKTVAVNTSNADLQFMERLEHRLEREYTEIEHAKQKYVDNISKDAIYSLLNRFKSVVDQTVHLLVEKKDAMVRDESAMQHIRDFKLIRVLGKGGFGVVYFAQNKKTQKFVAIKVLDKSLIRKEKKEEQVTRERKVLSEARHFPDYFVRLLCSFQDMHQLYMVMDFVPGGDCMTLLTSLKRFPEIVTQHFLAQVCVAVQHLHMVGIVHRDIKPDNVLITSRGHAVLADFGLVVPFPVREHMQTTNGHTSGSHHNMYGRQSSINSAVSSSGSYYSHARTQWLTDNSENLSPFDPSVNTQASNDEPSSSSLYFSRPDLRRKLNSRVGNFNYACPEIVIGSGYDHTVDWWAVAVMCFHFLTGITPFEAATPEDTMENIVLFRANWDLLPSSVSNECKDFMAAILLAKSPEERLGHDEVLNSVLAHDFFVDIDFYTLYEGQGPLYPDLVKNGVNKSLFTQLSLTDTNDIPDYAVRYNEEKESDHEGRTACYEGFQDFAFYS